MISDFNVLAGVQKYIRAKLAGQQVYLTLPPEAKFPCAVVEGDQVALQRLRGKKQGKVTFRIDCLSQAVGEMENSHQSAEINAVIDGAFLPLEKGVNAMIRYLMTTKSLHQGRKVMQNHYEALVREDELREDVHG